VKLPEHIGLALNSGEEPKMTVNGHLLTPGQAMTVRVALGTFAITLEGNGLGDDETGKAICAGYLARIAEVNAMMREPRISGCGGIQVPFELGDRREEPKA
jgi:hypothetical protein